MANREARLQCVIADYLRAVAPGLLFWSCRNESSEGARNGALFKKMGRHPGASDLMALRDDGLLICMEVKLPTDKVYKTKKTYQTSEQKTFEKEIKKRSSMYYVVRSTEDVLAVLEECEIPAKVSAWTRDRRV